MGLQGGVEIVADHPGLRNGVDPVDSNILDPIHSLHVHHDPTHNGDHLAAESRARPSRDEGNLRFIGIFNDPLDLVYILGSDHGIRFAPVDAPVKGIYIEVRLGGRTILLPHDRHEPVRELLGVQVFCRAYLVFFIWL